MKKLLAVLVLAFGIFFLGCEKEDPVPPCEANKVGSVTVKNSTGYNVWVDVTWGDVAENYEKLLYNGNSYPYENVPANGHPQSYGGTIEIWVSFDGNDWYYEIDNLSPCEDMLFTWYLNARKSTGLPFDLDFNGRTIEAKRAVDHPSKTKVWNY